MKNRFVVKYGTAGASLLAMAGAARAEDPATALAALQSLSGTTAGFGPVMFGLAVVAVGIGIGVKWIKRGKGAA